MKDRNSSGILLHLCVPLLLGGVLIAIISGIAILPELSRRLATESADQRIIRQILTILWGVVTVALLMGAIIVRHLAHVRINMQAMEISLFALRHVLEDRGVMLPHRIDAAVDYRNDRLEVHGLTGKSDN